MRIPTLTLLLLAGCQPVTPGALGDGGSVGDGGLALLSCGAPAGPTWVLNDYGLLPPDQGFDLVGDGKPHNILGALAPFANGYWASSVKGGFAIFLLDFPGLTGFADQKGFPFYFFVGIDVDDPPDPTNNLGGMGRFLVPAGAFDVSCQPTAAFNNTILASGVVTASTHRIDIVTEAIGDFISADDQVRATFTPDGSGITGSLGGVGTACAMTKTSSPIASQGNFTLLDTIVSQFQLQPDIDRDHDGLDRLMHDGAKVTACVLPDGTVIPGHSCPCDPRVQDGYSLAFYFTAVPAQIVGLSSAR